MHDGSSTHAANQAGASAPADPPCLVAALDYLRLGWSPLRLCPPDHSGPLPPKHCDDCDRPGKRVVGTWKAYQTIPATADTVRAWWRENPALNVGIATGHASGLLAFDVDDDTGEAELLRLFGGAIPETLTFTTGRRGRRLFFRLPPDRSFPRPVQHMNGAGLDVLSAGSQTVMPPSVHASGRLYAWSPGTDLTAPSVAVIPHEVLDLVVLAKGKKSSPVGGARGPALTTSEGAGQVIRARAYVQTFDPCVSGEGGQRVIFRHCCHLVHDFGLDDDTALSLLTEGFNQRCVPPWTEDELRHHLDGARKNGSGEPIPHKPGFGGGGNRRPQGDSDPVVPVRESMDQVLAGVVKATGERPLHQQQTAPPAPQLVSSPPASTNGQAEPGIPCVAASNLKEQKTTWMWEGRIPMGAFTLLDGKKGRGKSTLITAVVADATGGPRLPGRACKPRVLGNVLWFTSEEGPCVDIRPRLIVAGADPDRVFFPGFNADGRRVMRMDWDQHREVIRQMVRQHEACLVVVEPWTALNPAWVRTASDEAVRAVLEPLQDMAREEGFSAFGSRHLRKNGTGPATDQGLGSVGIGNVARSVLLVSPDPLREGWLVLASAACNVGAPPPSLSYRIVGEGDSRKVEWGGEVEVGAEDLVGEPEDPVDLALREQARRLVRARIGGKWVRASDVLAEGEVAGIPRHTVQKARKDVGAQCDRRGGIGEAGYWEWGPPEGGWPEVK